MKKRMSRILSALLVSALVISTGNVVQAEDAGVTGKPEVEDGVVAQQAAEAQEIGMMSVPDAAKELTAQATVNGSIPLKKITTGTKKELDSIDSGYITYSNTSNFRKGKDYYYGYSQQVSLTKGTLSFAVRGVSGQRIYFGLYRDAGLTDPVDSYSFTDVGSIRGETFEVPSPGTYYLGIYSSVYSNMPEGAVRVGALAAAGFCDGSERTLTSGKQVAVGAKKAQTIYFKFKVKKAGYITVKGDDAAYYYDVTLCNSKKKALSGATDLGWTPTYGVKKGTYYIKVKSSYNSDGAYTLKVTSNSSIKEKSGKNRAKAVTVKRKATKKGTIQIGSGQADWYKLKKTSKAKTTITINGRTNDKIKVTLYRGGKKLASGTFSYRDKGYKFTMSNYPKGTYYIKIERGSKKSSGYYSVKWS